MDRRVKDFCSVDIIKFDLLLRYYSGELRLVRRGDCNF